MFLLDRHEPHGWTGHGFADGLCIGGVILVGFYKRSDILGREQPYIVTHVAQQARPMMSTGTGLKANCARWQFFEERLNRRPFKLLS